MIGPEYAHLRQPMDTAPRNGLTVIVGHDDCGQFAMHWDPGAQNGLFPDKRGFWVGLDRSFTWSEHDGAGPEYWFHLPAENDAEVAVAQQRAPAAPSTDAPKSPLPPSGGEPS